MKLKGKVKFVSNDRTNFFEILKERVDEYFAANSISSTFYARLLPILSAAAPNAPPGDATAPVAQIPAAPNVPISGIFKDLQNTITPAPPAGRPVKDTPV